MDYLLIILDYLLVEEGCCVFYNVYQCSFQSINQSINLYRAI